MDEAASAKTSFLGELNGLRFERGSKGNWTGFGLKGDPTENCGGFGQGRDPR
jgi:hypothetical protein